MLVPERSTFDEGYRKICYVCPNAGTMYDSLVAKYGGDSVFIASSSAADVQINAAIAQCLSGANDAVYLAPGSYTLAATISVSKNITLRGAGRNANSVILAPATAVVAVTLTAAGDYAILRDFTITAGATAVQSILIPASCPGVMVDNVVINGADTSSTQIGITTSSDNTVVNKCRLNGVWKGVRSSGSNCLITNNYHRSTVTIAAAVGVDMTTGNYGVVSGNVFVTTTLNYLGVQIGSGGTVISAAVYDNKMTATTTGIRTVAATSTAIFNNFLSTTTTSLPAVVAA